MEKLEILVPADFNRFKVALDLQDGVNLRAIARSLVLAADAANMEGGGTAATYADPAVILIINKLESLVRSEAIGTFSRAFAECQQRSVTKRRYPDPMKRRPTLMQKRALKRLWERGRETHPSYLRLRRNAYWETAGNALLVPWCGMTVGIEPDGYTHS